MNKREAIDQDGNVIREGMLIIFDRQQLVVKNIAICNGRAELLSAIGILEDGRIGILLLGRNMLRHIQIIGFQSPYNL